MLEQPPAGWLRLLSRASATSRRFSTEPTFAQSGTSGTQLFRREAAAYALRRPWTTQSRDRALTLAIFQHARLPPPLQRVSSGDAPYRR